MTSTRNYLCYLLLFLSAQTQAVLLVSDGGGHGGVYAFNHSTGEFQDILIPSQPNLGNPRGLTIGPDGNLYVVAPANPDVIQKYDPRTGARLGAFVTSVQSNGLVSPGGLKFGADGNIYVTNGPFGPFPHSVMRYRGDTGQFLDVFVSSGAGGLTRPQDLAFGPDGNLYVTSEQTSEILRFDVRTGEFMDSFVSAFDGGLNGPTGLAFGPEGDLYVATLVGGIFKYDGFTGEFLSQFVVEPGLASLSGVAFGPDGNIYVSSSAHAILRYDRVTGAFLGTFGSAPSPFSPSYLAFAPAVAVVPEPHCAALLVVALPIFAWLARRSERIPLS